MNPIALAGSLGCIGLLTVGVGHAKAPREPVLQYVVYGQLTVGARIFQDGRVERLASRNAQPTSTLEKRGWTLLTRMSSARVTALLKTIGEAG
jgi:hypothetical protein